MEPNSGTGMIGFALAELERKRAEDEQRKALQPRAPLPPRPEAEALAAYNAIQHDTSPDAQVEKCRIGMELALRSGKTSEYKALLELQSKLRGCLTDKVVERQTERHVEKIVAFNFTALPTKDLESLKRAMLSHDTI